ncbi:unnamed protein product [Arabidopsis lyrata]|uniref:Predicted protein n=1 Tax=Arabidopsis lyrata subsp. lyrata TaxID=81972 RepID=D7LP12_ARALL|nr:predicted protein [Arabidopsis lyrata subsp. lyrata]CAH8267190.1 unnamed protein product [Arabidopsis lyrata]
MAAPVVTVAYISGGTRWPWSHALSLLLHQNHDGFSQRRPCKLWNGGGNQRQQHTIK